MSILNLFSYRFDSTKVDISTYKSLRNIKKCGGENHFKKCIELTHQLHMRDRRG